VKVFFSASISFRRKLARRSRNLEMDEKIIDPLTGGSKPTRDVLSEQYRDPNAQQDDDINETDKQDFDLELVGECFDRCLKEDKTIGFEEYIAAYKELCRFFNLMGRIFGFVAEDIEEKIATMEALIHDKPEKYATVQIMLDYEVTNNLARSKIKTSKEGLGFSGTKTLLRLHRSLEFILEFMRRMGDGTDDSKTSQIASDVYDETLAKYHYWIIRKMAVFAMFTLPNRKELVRKMCKQSYEEAQKLVVTAAANGQKVYDQTDKLFEQFELTDIPYY